MQQRSVALCNASLVASRPGGPSIPTRTRTVGFSVVDLPQDGPQGAPHPPRVRVLRTRVAALPAHAVKKNKAAYLGGTIQGVEPGDDGSLWTDGDAFVWMSEDAGRPISIPCKRFVEIEYGQKEGHRVKTAIPWAER